MADEKSDILRRVEQGTLDVEEAVSRLSQMQEGTGDEPASPEQGDDLLYVKDRWVEFPDPSLESSRPPATVLLIDSTSRRIDALRRSPSTRAVVQVVPGDHFQKKARDEYVVDVQDPNCIDQLVEALVDHELMPTHILHAGLLEGNTNSSGPWGPDRMREGGRQGVRVLFLLLRGLLDHQVNLEVEVITLVGPETPPPIGAMSSAFGNVVHAEVPGATFRSIYLEQRQATERKVLEQIFAVSAAADQPVSSLRLSEEGCTCRALIETDSVDPSAAEEKFGAARTCLVTGGTGNIGRVVVRHLAEKSVSEFILTGRSSEPTQLVNTLAAETESDIVYVQADVTDHDAMERVVRVANERFDGLDGVVHTAGVLRDSLLINKPLEDFDAVLAPKVSGAPVLDSVTADEALEFFVLFSSLASEVPQGGQCAYAAANRFLDQFALARSDWVQAGERSGHTVSIAWPLWSEGGMQMPEEERERLREEAGFASMPTEAGLQAFDRAVAGKEEALKVFFGETDRLRLMLREQYGPTAAVPSDSESGKTADEANSAEVHREDVKGYLLDLISKKAEMPVDRIDPSADLESIGLDSILVNRITTTLEDDVGSLPATLLYEYQSIEELTDYFLDHRSGEMAQVVGSASQEREPDEQNGPSSADVEAPANEQAEPHEQSARDERASPEETTRHPEEDDAESDQAFAVGAGEDRSAVHTHMQETRTEDQPDEIAVVGVAGRYPDASTLPSFWENLRRGHDSIREIPENRWDHDRYFHPDREKDGTAYSKWGGFLDDVYHFDPLFFNISPLQAEQMDPQERLFLEVAWSALERAGYTRDDLLRSGPIQDERPVGVFAGVTSNDYEAFSAEAFGRNEFIPAQSEYWSVANRVSYTLDFNGPSMAVDTACSSSLVAVQLACQSLRQENCEVALAGGVNLLLHPTKYLALSHMQMLSTDGRCRAFGAGGDGYVPGEGAGVVVLKSLDDALQSDDHIYGIIRGGATNHGGKTNGYTVPNPSAQASVVQKAIDQSGIDPRSIGYVEAHGTGTELGDPIEIEGLKKVFEPAHDSQFCGIGSVKSNLGHLEGAAGIAALTKVLLQLENGTLVPSLHSETRNPNLNFEDSPFYVCRTTETWSPRTVDGKTPPRRAAISSFGAGGANAHLIVEDFEGVAPQPSVQEAEAIVLSARSEDRIPLYAERLRDALEKRSDLSLANVAYTLQTGREAFAERVAFVVSEKEEMVEVLDAIARGAAEEAPVPVYRGRETGEEPTGPSSSEKLLRARDWDDLLERWVQGASVDWSAHPSADERACVPLPTYPFDRQPYGLPDSVSLPAPDDLQSDTRPEEHSSRSPSHPHITEIVPRLDGVEAHIRLEPSDSIVAQHVVNGQAVLPGTAHVTLARAVAMRVTEAPVAQIEEVQWRAPVRVEEPTTLRLQVKAEGPDAATYSVRSGSDGDRALYSGGKLGLAKPATSPAPVSIDELEARAAPTLEGKEVYAQYEQNGISYGSLFQRVLTVSVGEEEAVARLQPHPDAGPYDDVHPAMLDGALHVTSVFASSEEGPRVPVGVDRLTLHDRLEDARYAIARPRQRSSDRDGVFDVRVTDEQGRCLAKIEGFTTHRLRSSEEDLRDGGNAIHLSASASEVHAEEENRVPKKDLADAFTRPVWREVPLDTQDASENEGTSDGAVLICEHEHDGGIGAALAARFGQRAVRVDLTQAPEVEVLVETIRRSTPLSTIYFLGGVETRQYSMTDLEQLEVSQERGPVALFRLLKALVQTGTTDTSLRVITTGVYATPSDHSPTHPFGGALEGIARTAGRELSSMRVVCLDVGREDVPSSGAFEDSDAWDLLLNRLCHDPGTETGMPVAWRGECRRVRQLERISLGSPSQEALPFRDEGVYLIIGGSGGLGDVFARYLAKHYRARLILVGRSERSEDIQEQLQTLTDLGAAEARYQQADVTDVESMEAVVRQIRSRFGELHGVLHSALVLRDASLQTMDEEQFRGALAPKVRGTVVLHHVLETEPLDVLAFFSSSLSFTTTPGQANYAGGCTFEDQFAQALRRRKKRLVRIVNWGFWGEVGAVATPEYRERMKQRGVAPITVDEGVEAFERILGGGAPQVMAIKLKDQHLNALGIDPDTRRHRLDVAAKKHFAPSVDACRRQAEKSEAFDADALSRLDGVARRYLVQWFQEQGWFHTPGATVERPTLKRRLSVGDGKERLFRALVDLLVRSGYLTAEGDRLEATDRIREAQEAEAREESLLEDAPDAEGYLRLLHHCLEQYASVLAGRTEGVEVLFPNGQTDYVDRVYRDNRRADYFNELAAEGIGEVVEATAEPVSIVEVGAGTGGTTASVLPVLAPYAERVRYHYTDISPQFLEVGRRRFGEEHSFVQFQEFDATERPGSQGMEEGRHDVVLATNVLHATERIGTTLNRLKRLLRPGGVLLINEVTRSSDVATMTFGLTEGWWAYEDPEQRLPNAPLLSVSQWREALAGAGYRRVEAIGFPGERAEESGQALIVAESDGWIEQRKAERGRDKPEAEETLRSQPVGDAAQGQIVASGRNASPESTRAETEGEDTGDPATEVSKDEVIEEVKENVAEVLKMPPSDLERDVDFQRYGVDSLVAMNIVEALEEQYGELPQDLLFDYPTIDALASYLASTGTEGTNESTSPSSSRRSNSASPESSLGSREPAEHTAVSSPETPEGGTEEASSSRLEPSAEGERVLNQRAGERSSSAAGPTSLEGGTDPIAIVGLDFTLPESEDADAFWETLRHRQTAIKELPSDRWNPDDYYDPSGETPGTSYGRWGAFLEGVDTFDPLFFGISPLEAERMDPQERLFLQSAWAAVEDAGYVPERLGNDEIGGGVGVYAGTMYGDYQRLATEQWAVGNYANGYSAYWSIANRVSHVMGFQGPSMAIDTACSSGLTALHHACEGLRRGECSAALAGGINLILHPSHLVHLSQMEMLSRGAHADVFGADGDGLVPGEGVGCVVLKSLPDAEANGDHIYGVIRASALNNDGGSNDFTVPNADAHERLLRHALERANLSPREIDYVEAQALGSVLADGIEIDALQRLHGGREDACRVGSVKGNLGHLEAASGIAQLAKLLLQFDRETLAPTRTPDVVRKELRGNTEGLILQDEEEPWPSRKGNAPRRAGINSFGAGGANAHLIVEEYRSQPAPQGASQSGSENGPHLLVLSARTEERLRAYAREMAEALEDDNRSIADITYTLQVGRVAQNHRCAAPIASHEELLDVLNAVAKGHEYPSLYLGRRERECQEQPLPPAQVRDRLAAGDLEEVARDWVRGHDVDWSAVHGSTNRHRLSLPTYPFEERSYWIDVEPTPSPTSESEVLSPAPEEGSSSETSTTARARSSSQTKDPSELVASEGGGSSSVSGPNHSSSTMSSDHDSSSPSFETTAAPSTEDVQGEILSLMADVLGVRPEEVYAEDDLGDYGFDSITLARFAEAINDRFGVDISPALFFQYSTVERLTQHLMEAHSESVRAAFDATTEEVSVEQSAPATSSSNGTSSSEGPTSVGEEGSNTSTAETVTGQENDEFDYAPAHNRTERRDTHHSGDIAVVGMSGRLPGASTLDEFWDRLENQESMIREIPEERFDWREIYGDAMREKDKTNSKWGGFIEDVDRFDADFFDISPREAQVMDPQQRLFMEVVWSTIEEAGYDPAALAGTSTGLFVGVASSEYSHMLSEYGVELDGKAASGTAHSILANRISYLLDLRGPSEPIDTACSSSLVALHRAVQSIRLGECSQALVGGVNLLLTPAGFLAFGKSGMLAEDGLCKTFDARADGYVRGEGVAAVMVKPLEQAQADGDHIYGVIRGSALNHGGYANSLTAPNAEAQAEVIEEALEDADVSADTISFVETHGTGTKLGDPVEINGLKQAFREAANGALEGGRCALGAVKTNVGHLETAAGIAGVVKVLLALDRETLPGLANFESLNPHIDLEDGPFRLLRRTEPWHRPRTREGRELPRRAGVSSFGFGGVNAHVVFEESRTDRPRNSADFDHDREEIVVLSAQTEERLHAYAERLSDHLADDPPPLVDLAYTLQVGRPSMNARLAIVASSVDAVRDQLQSFLDSDGSTEGTDWYLGTAEGHRDVMDLVNEEEVSQDFVSLLASRKRLRTIASLWTKGLDVDWEPFHETERRRVSLPTYPFARVRHWVTQRADVETNNGQQMPLVGGHDDAAGSEAGGNGTLADETAENEPVSPPARPQPDHSGPSSSSADISSGSTSEAETESEVDSPRASTNGRGESEQRRSSSGANSSLSSASETVPTSDSTSEQASSETEEAPVDSSSGGDGAALEDGGGRPPSAPTSSEDVIEEVRELFADYLSLEADSMDRDEDFQAYGVDSIAGLRLMQQIQDRYGEDVPMMAIVKHPTLERFGTYLFENFAQGEVATNGDPPTSETPSSPAKTEKRDPSGSSPSASETATAPSEASETSSESKPDVASPGPDAASERDRSTEKEPPPTHSTVVPLQPDGDNRPLFGLHADSGEVSWLKGVLAKRGEEAPTYGVEALGFDGTYSEKNSIEEMAEYAAESIRDVASETEIDLAGHGAGALVAYEAARRLQERGTSVERLLLVSPLVPGSSLHEAWANRAEEDPLFGLTVAANLCGQLWETNRSITYQSIASATDPVDHVVSGLQAYASPLMGSDDLETWVKNATTSVRALLEATQDYEPTSCSKELDTVLLKTSLDVDRFADEYGLPVPDDQTPEASLLDAWQPLLENGNLRVHSVPNDHFSVLRPEVVARSYRRITQPTVPGRSSSEEEVARARRDESGRTFLVPINNNGGQTASFWTHTLLGDVSYCVNISHQLGIEYPLYGFEQLHSDDEADLLPTIDQMAAAYVRTLRETVPEGPYVLGGYSFGGVVAFEMARQLVEAGERVSEIIMLDAIMPNTPVFESIDTDALGEVDFSIMSLILIGNTFGDRWNGSEYILIDDIAHLEREGQIYRVARHLYETSEIPYDFEGALNLVRVNHETIISNNDALVNYKPRSLGSDETRVLLFKAGQGFVGPDNPNDLPVVELKEDDMTNGFGEFVSGPLNTIVVDGADHYTICDREHVITVGKHMKQGASRLVSE